MWKCAEKGKKTHVYWKLIRSLFVKELPYQLCQTGCCENSTWPKKNTHIIHSKKLIPIKRFKFLAVKTKSKSSHKMQEIFHPPSPLALFYPYCLSLTEWDTGYPWHQNLKKNIPLVWTQHWSTMMNTHTIRRQTLKYTKNQEC